MSDLLPGLTLYSGASCMPNDAMGGVVLAQTRVATYLSLSVPHYVSSFYAYMGLPNPGPLGPNLLPIPTGGFGAGYFDYEPPVLDAGNMPFQTTTGAAALIYVASPGTPQITQRQADSLGNPMYDVSYDLAATCWVRSRTISGQVDINATKEAWGNCSKGRSNLVTLMRLCFLMQPDLGTLGVCRVEVNSFNEARAMPIAMQSKGATFLAGGSLNFRMWSRETLTIPPVGIVADPVNINEQMLQIHPALLGPDIGQ